MPLTGGGVWRLSSPGRSPTRSVGRSVDVATRLRVLKVGDGPFFERAWMAKGRSLTLGRSKVRWDCGSRRRKRRSLRSSCQEMLRFANARGRSCCSSRCSCLDCGR